MSNNDQKLINYLEKLEQILENETVSSPTLSETFLEMMAQDYESAPNTMVIDETVENPLETLTIRGLIQQLVETALKPDFELGFATPLFGQNVMSNRPITFSGALETSVTYESSNDDLIYLDILDEYDEEYNVIRVLKF